MCVLGAGGGGGIIVWIAKCLALGSWDGRGSGVKEISNYFPS